MATASDSSLPARYWQRFAAVFVDFGLLLLIAVSLGESLEGWFSGEPIGMFITWPIFLVLMFFCFLFSGLEHSRLGATPGMLLVGIRAVRPFKPVALVLRRLWLFLTRPLAVALTFEIFALMLSLSGLVYDQYSIGLGLAFVLFTGLHFATVLLGRFFWKKVLQSAQPMVVKGFPPQKLYMLTCLLVTGAVALTLTYPWSLPAYQSKTEQRNGMDDLHTMLAIYANDADSLYPVNLAQLYYAANGPERAYWTHISNAYTGRTGIGPRGALLDFKDYREHPEAAGLILYQPGAEPSEPYTLHACGPDGKIRESH